MVYGGDDGTIVEAATLNGSFNHLLLVFPAKCGLAAHEIL